jgi:hypothetical protein
MKRHKRWMVSLLAFVMSAIVVSVTLGVGMRISVDPETVHAAGLSAENTVLPAQPATVGDEAPPAARPTVMASADFTVLYDNVGGLKKAADLIVRGEVTGVSYLDFNSTAYSKVTLRVSKCLKGDVAAGEEITIVEVGGVTTMATVNGDKFGGPTELDAETEVTVLLEGAPLSEVGEKCLYFLGTGSIGVVPGTYYVPLGAFQGRFKIDDAVAKRFVPVDWAEGDYTELPMAESGIDQTVLRARAE